MPKMKIPKIPKSGPTLGTLEEQVQRERWKLWGKLLGWEERRMKFKLMPNQNESDVLDSISRIVSPIRWDAAIEPGMVSYRLDYGNNWFAKIEGDTLTIAYRYATGQPELMEAYARVIAHQTGLERVA